MTLRQSTNNRANLTTTCDYCYSISRVWTSKNVNVHLGRMPALYTDMKYQ